MTTHSIGIKLQLWSGSENVETRYVNGSFVAGTSALSPGVPCHVQGDDVVVVSGCGPLGLGMVAGAREKQPKVKKIFFFK